jgi:hypothetical protein
MYEIFKSDFGAKVFSNVFHFNPSFWAVSIFLHGGSDLFYACLDLLNRDLLLFPHRSSPS